MDDFEHHLNDVLTDTFNYILKYEETTLKTILNTPITVSEAHMIEAIDKKENGATASELAAMLNISMPTVTVAVKKLERKGFVLKAPSADDGRSNRINLTKLGKKIGRAHKLFHQKMVKNISGDFTEEEKNVLLSAIVKLSGFFKGKAEA